jgi:hypothetical protein
MRPGSLLLEQAATGSRPCGALRRGGQAALKGPCADGTFCCVRRYASDLKPDWERTMPIILWLLGVPLGLVILLVLLGVV